MEVFIKASKVEEVHVGGYETCADVASRLPTPTRYLPHANAQRREQLGVCRV
jgi:hypothetical protein